MRNLRRILLICIATMLCAPCAWAYPEKPITLIVPFAPGGLADSLARILAKGLTQRMGQPVIVDFKTGAGGIVAFQHVRSVPADGYTILLGTISTTSLAPLIVDNLPFDLEKDFAPVAMTFVGSNVVVVPATGNVGTLKDLAALARTKPGGINYASAGNATTQHLLGALFGQLAGSQMTHLPYRGTNPALMATITGEADVMFSSMDALAHIRSGRLRALAVTSAQRQDVLPDVPTVAEAGMPELVLESFYGVLAASATPRPVLERLNREIAAVLSEETNRRAVEMFNVNVAPDFTQKYFADQMKAETARWQSVVKANHITAN